MKGLLGNISVAKKMLLLGSLFVATLFGVVLYTVLTLHSQEANGGILNLAGRERMLTQKFTKEVMAEVLRPEAGQQDSEKTAKLFETTLQGLREGGEVYLDLGMTKTAQIHDLSNDVEVEKSLTEVAVEWQELRALAQKLGQSPADSEAFNTLAQELNNQSIKILASMNHAVTMMTEDSLKAITTMVNVEWLIFVLAMLILGALLYLIASAITQPLNLAVEIAQNIAKGDLNSQVDSDAFPNDELGDLLKAQQAMSVSIAHLLERELTVLLASAKAGDLAQRISMQDKQGFYAVLTTELNDFMAATEQTTADTVKSLKALDQGDLSCRITANVEGEFDVLKQAGNGVTQKLHDILVDEIVPVLSAAKAGELSGRIEIQGKVGFYADLANEINDLLTVSEQIIDDTVEALKALENGDLTHVISNTYKGQFDVIKQASNQTSEKLAATMNDIRNTAMNVADGSAEISQGNSTLSDRTQEQAASLEETSASIEEITGTIQQNADNARQANQLAINTSEQAEKGGAVASEAVEAMSSISASSKKISDIIGVIDEIAFQTNLLALNAAVEAARAGEQGRGFAVVAGEVRTLAGRSAEAAKEIKGMINASVESVAHGSKLVDDSGAALTEIMASVQKVTDIIAEISAASQEQAAGVDQINKAITQLDAAVQQNAALVEETAASSANLDQGADEVLSLVDGFNMGNNKPVKARSTVKKNTSVVSNKPVKATEPSTVGASAMVSDGDSWDEF